MKDEELDKWLFSMTGMTLMMVTIKYRWDVDNNHKDNHQDNVSHSDKELNPDDDNTDDNINKENVDDIMTQL